MTNRADAINVIKSRDTAHPIDLYKAIFALQRDPKPHDESLLEPLLNEKDEMVVSATLFALVNIYDQAKLLKEQILQMSKGDERDTGEMPIQAQAIESLAVLAEREPELRGKLLEIAEDESMAEAPRARAWQCLARLADLPWSRKFTEDLIFSPDSKLAEQIKEPIRHALKLRGHPF